VASFLPGVLSTGQWRALLACKLFRHQMDKGAPSMSHVAGRARACVCSLEWTVVLSKKLTMLCLEVRDRESKLHCAPINSCPSCNHSAPVNLHTWTQPGPELPPPAGRHQQQQLGGDIILKGGPCSFGAQCCLVQNDLPFDICSCDTIQTS
jgi:hypothetical protein